MNFSLLMVNATSIAGFATAFALASIVLWLFVRKRLVRMWLPTLRKIDLKTQILPRLTWARPPFLSFLCFVISALALLFFTLEPKQQIPLPKEPHKMRLHFFLDMSPSVSAWISLPEYADRVAATWEAWHAEARITVGTSHDTNVFEVATADELRGLVTGKGFHRAGLRLGSAITEQMVALPDSDRILIFSDRGEESWLGFNWKYLGDELEVNLVDLVDAPSAKHENVFVDRVTTARDSVSGARRVEYDVDLARVGARSIRGTIEARRGDTLLASLPWEIPAGRARVTVRVGWVLDQEGNSAAAPPVDDALTWRILPADPDQVALDNEFRSYAQPGRGQAWVVSTAQGEQWLEDPAHELEVILGVVGFDVKRVNQLDGPAEAGGASSAPSLIALWSSGLSDETLKEFCPFVGKAPQKPRDTAANVWLIPHEGQQDFSKLCDCLAAYWEDDPRNALYCKNVKTRMQWIGLLPSLGGKQIGGDVGDGGSAVAYRFKKKDSPREVYAFTIPLRPLPGSGLTHGTTPLLVKRLLTLGAEEPTRPDAPSRPSLGEWPRIGDLTAFLAEGRDKEPRTTELNARQSLANWSNVPSGESLLSLSSRADLPPIRSVSDRGATLSSGSFKNRIDPLPYLRLCAAIVLVAIFLEGVMTLLKFFRAKGAAKATLTALAVTSAFAFIEKPCHAGVMAAMLGYGTTPLRFAELAKEVSGRTSIELEQDAVQYPQWTLQSLSEGWLWVRSPAAIVGGGGGMQGPLAKWIKRGGFLVVDDYRSVEAINQLSEKMFRGEGVGAPTWIPIPPDHELMRSFYLLESLPQCARTGQMAQWYGLQYDHRLIALAIPFSLLESLADSDVSAARCFNSASERERGVRAFVNILMVALTTDYKKDQIHLPEILKRLR